MRVLALLLFLNPPTATASPDFDFADCEIAFRSLEDYCPLPAPVDEPMPEEWPHEIGMEYGLEWKEELVPQALLSSE